MLAPHSTGSYVHPDDPGEPTTGEPRLSITDLEADILRALARGRAVLEIGTGLGVSTRAMAETAIRVFTIDLDPWVHANVWPTLPANVEGCTSVGGVQSWFDLAFIDGDHSTEAVVADITAVMAAIDCEGVIVAHDTNSKTVRDGLERVCGPWDYIATTHGLGVCLA